MRGRESGKALTAAARANIEAAILSGFTAARSLDIIVANELSDDAVLVAQWQRGRRVGYPGAKDAADGPAVSTGAPSAPTAQPAAGASSSSEASDEAGKQVFDAPEVSEMTMPVDVTSSDTPEVSEVAAEGAEVEAAGVVGAPDADGAAGVVAATADGVTSVAESADASADAGAPTSEAEEAA